MEVYEILEQMRKMNTTDKQGNNETSPSLDDNDQASRKTINLSQVHCLQEVFKTKKSNLKM